MPTPGGDNPDEPDDDGATGSSSTEEPVRHFDGVPVVSSADLSSRGFGTPWGHTRVWTGLNNGSLNGNGWGIAELPYLVVGGGSNGTSSGGGSPIPDGTSGVLAGTRDDHRISVVGGSGVNLVFGIPAPLPGGTGGGGTGVEDESFLPTSSSGSRYSTHTPWGAGQSRLDWDATNGVMRVTDTRGNITEFHDVFRAGDDSTNFYHQTDPERPMPRSLASDPAQKYGRFKRFVSANGTTEIEANYDGDGNLSRDL